MPSPNHGTIACLVATFLRSVDIGGARLIRDLGGIISTYLVNGHPSMSTKYAQSIHEEKLSQMEL